MNKRLSKTICIITSMVLCFAFMMGTNALNNGSANAENDKTAFSSEITALSHAHGETINILPEEVRLWNESERFDADQLNGLYEYSDLHRQFTKVLNDDAKLVEIYSQADAFNPVSNVLRWTSSLENVESYKVRVAYDNKFTKCVLIVDDADIDEGVVLENPLTGITYYWQVIATKVGGDKVYSSIFDFNVADSLRTVTVEGVSNTRDIGGYQTAYGYVKQGLVYRSARLESITAAGLYTLKNQLGVKTDLDLRGEVEATTKPNRKNPADMDYYYTFVTPQYANLGTLGLDEAANFENVKNIMTVFTDKDNYPIDFHCAVGRDRTGTIAALLKSVLGYSEQDILNDYFTSLFSTTGAWDKAITSVNKDSIMFVLSYLNTFDGETLADRAAEYLITKCGMSQDDIDAIRNIMTGQEGYEIDIPAYNTTEDIDNYSGFSFVKFEKFGVKTILLAVENGETVEAPYDAGNGYVWTDGGLVYDFTASVDEDITVKALKTATCEVDVYFTGDITEQRTITVVEGASFDFSIIQAEGYDYTVISDEGKVINELTVNGKTTINVVCIQK